MHDPDVVVFDVPLPIPARLWPDKNARWGIKRRLYTGTGPKAGTPIDPWWMPRAWAVSAPGRRLVWWKPVTVWHNEPGGADSGRVCKGMGGSDLTVHNVCWAWTHRGHLQIQVRPWDRYKAWRNDRCDECGKGFRWKDDCRIGTWGGDKVWHDKCHSLVHVRSQLDDLTAVARFDADDNTRRRVESRLRHLDEQEASTTT